MRAEELLEKIKQEYAKEAKFENWEYLVTALSQSPLSLEANYDEVAHRYVQEYAKQKLEEVREVIENSINDLQDDMDIYREMDDQYSWHIVEDEQIVWKQSRDLIDKTIEELDQ